MTCLHSHPQSLQLFGQWMKFKSCEGSRDENDLFTYLLKATSHHKAHSRLTKRITASGRGRRMYKAQVDSGFLDRFS